MNRERTFVTLTLVVLAVTSITCSLPARWEKLSEAGFTVEMPGKPERQTQTVNTPAGPIKVNMLMVEKAGEGFFVAYNDYPRAAAESLTTEQVLSGALDGAVRKVNGTVTSQRDVAIGAVPGKELIGNASMPQEGTFTVRVYWISPRLYQVLYVRPKNSSSSTNSEKFFTSFQLTGQ